MAKTYKAYKLIKKSTVSVMSSAIANGAVIADNSRLVLQGFASKLDDFPAQNSNPAQIAQCWN